MNLLLFLLSNAFEFKNSKPIISINYEQRAMITLTDTCVKISLLRSIFDLLNPELVVEFEGRLEQDLNLERRFLTKTIRISSTESDVICYTSHVLLANLVTETRSKQQSYSPTTQHCSLGLVRHPFAPRVQLLLEHTSFLVHLGEANSSAFSLLRPKKKHAKELESLTALVDFFERESVQRTVKVFPCSNFGAAHKIKIKKVEAKDELFCLETAGGQWAIQGARIGSDFLVLSATRNNVMLTKNSQQTPVGSVDSREDAVLSGLSEHSVLRLIWRNERFEAAADNVREKSWLHSLHEHKNSRNHFLTSLYPHKEHSVVHSAYFTEHCTQNRELLEASGHQCELFVHLHEHADLLFPDSFHSHAFCSSEKCLGVVGLVGRNRLDFVLANGNEKVIVVLKKYSKVKSACLLAKGSTVCKPVPEQFILNFSRWKFVQIEDESICYFLTKNAFRKRKCERKIFLKKVI